MALTAIISFAVQNKGFGYHLGGLIPILAMSALGGINLAFASTQYSSKPVQNVSRALAIAFFVFGVGLERRTQNNLLPYVRSAAIAGQCDQGDAPNVKAVIDLNEPLSAANWTTDGIHLGPEGYVLWTRRWLKG